MKAFDPLRTSLGTWCQVGHPANAAILAGAGFAWVAADCEHGEFEDGDLADFCRAVRLGGAVPLVRVRENATLAIRRALDLGAAGVVVPLVDSAADAVRAAAAAHYPPRGVRGFAWQAANGYGRDFDAYAAGFEPLVLAMIETRGAVECAEDILAVDGIDGCVVGPYDLSGSYGIPGQTGHPLVVQACASVAAACRRLGKAAGQHLVVPDRAKVQAAIGQGYSVLALGMDTQFIADGARRALEDAQ